MEIREVRPEEHEAAGDLTAAAYREFVPDDPSPTWAEYLESLRDVSGRVGKTVVLVAVEDGHPIGTATIEMDQTLGDDDLELPPDTASLRMLGVAPGARGRGVGRALVEDTIGRERRAGKRHLTLRTTPLMQTAQRLYRAMGFERDPSLDQSYPEVELIGYRFEL
jgi:ribosomal protein S18 acetylase RimI-like enzyme